MAGGNNTVDELKGIFPQYDKEVISYIFNEVSVLFGIPTHPSILPSCIERLLELPEGFRVPEPAVAFEQNENQVVVEHFLNATIDDRRESPILDSSSSRVSTNSSLNESAEDQTNEYYRNKERPTYRQRPSSSESSSPLAVPKKEIDYFPDDDFPDSDELLLLEDRSTSKDRVRPKVLDDDDDEVIEVNVTIGRSKRKMDTPSASTAPKRIKTPGDNVNTPLILKRSTIILTNDGFKYSSSSTPAKPNNTFNNTPAKLSFVETNSASSTQTRPNTDINTNASINTNSLPKPFVDSKHLKVSTSTPRPYAIGSTITTTTSSTKANIVSHSAATPEAAVTIAATQAQQNGAFSGGFKSPTTPVTPTLIKVPTPTPQPPPPPPPPPPPVLVDIANLKKGMKDFDYYAKKRIKDVINDVSVSHLDALIRNHPDQTLLEQVVTAIVMQLLEDRNYPKEPKVRALKTPSPMASLASNKFEYEKQAMHELQKNFPMIRVKCLRLVFARQKRKYMPTFQHIEELLRDVKEGKKKIENTVLVGFMKGRRNGSFCTSTLDPLLMKELSEMDSEKKRLFEEKDLQTAMAINNQQYEEDGQAIECGCCYVESTFDDMVQCMEGHLFCSECLRTYSKEATFGGGKSTLVCMTGDCGASFPLSQLRKALPEKVLAKFQENEQNEALKLANIENLFTCPHCDFAMEVPGNEKVFSCQNPSCMKETCMHCKEAWDDEHFGVPCKEMEKKDETKLRRTWEEKMTEAKIRKCWQCKATFLKDSGCNKITCKCGAKMCYICRKPKIDYKHFCGHVRDPGHPCKVCKSCSLWTDPKEDDDRAVREIQKQAEEERKKLGGSDDNNKHIGPKIDVAAVNNNNRPAPYQVPRFLANAPQLGNAHAHHQQGPQQRHPFRRRR